MQECCVVDPKSPADRVPHTGRPQYREFTQSATHSERMGRVAFGPRGAYGRQSLRYITAGQSAEVLLYGRWSRQCAVDGVTCDVVLDVTVGLTPPQCGANAPSKLTRVLRFAGPQWSEDSQYVLAADAVDVHVAEDRECVSLECGRPVLVGLWIPALRSGLEARNARCESLLPAQPDPAAFLRTPHLRHRPAIGPQLVRLAARDSRRRRQVDAGALRHHEEGGGDEPSARGVKPLPGHLAQSLEGARAFPIRRGVAPVVQNAVRICGAVPHQVAVIRLPLLTG